MYKGRGAFVKTGRYWSNISTNYKREISVIKLSSGVNDLSETRMDNGRNVFVKMNAMNTTYYKDLYKPNTVS